MGGRQAVAEGGLLHRKDREGGRRLRTSSRAPMRGSVRRIAAPMDTHRSSAVDHGGSQLRGVSLIMEAWRISTELLCIIFSHLSRGKSRQIYYNARFFVVGRCRRTVWQFFCMAVAENRSTELGSSIPFFPPDRSRRVRWVLFLDNTLIQLNYKVVSRFSRIFSQVPSQPCVCKAFGCKMARRLREILCSWHCEQLANATLW